MLVLTMDTWRADTFNEPGPLAGVTSFLQLTSLEFPELDACCAA